MARTLLPPTAHGMETTSNWSTDLSGSLTPGLWSTGSTADFAAGTSVTGAYTVTVSGTQTTSGVIFEEGTVTLSGGTISLTGATPTFFNAAGGTNSVPKSIVINSTLPPALQERDLRPPRHGVTSYSIGGNNSALRPEKSSSARAPFLTSGTFPATTSTSSPPRTQLRSASARQTSSTSPTPQPRGVVNFSRVTLNWRTQHQQRHQHSLWRRRSDQFLRQHQQHRQQLTWSGNIATSKLELQRQQLEPRTPRSLPNPASLDITGTIQNGTGTGLDHANWSKIGSGTVISRSRKHLLLTSCSFPQRRPRSSRQRRARDRRHAPGSHRQPRHDPRPKPAPAPAPVLVFAAPPSAPRRSSTTAPMK